MPGTVRALQADDLFAELSADEVTTLYERTPVRTFAAGELLFTPLEPQRVTFLLLEGRVRLFQLNIDGKVSATGLVEPGALFGEMTLLGQSMIGNYAESLDVCRVGVLQVDDVEGLLLSDPRIARRVIQSLGQRVADLENTVYAMSLKDVGEKVAAILLYAGMRYDKRDPDGHLVVGITHEYLGAVVGLNRETVTRTLNDFQRRGWVRLSRGRIVLLDLRALRANSG